MTINAAGTTTLRQIAYSHYSNVLSGQTQQNEEVRSEKFNLTETDTKSTSVSPANITSQDFPELFSTAGLPLTPLSVQLKAIHVSELPEEQYQQFMQMQKQLIEANQKYLENQYRSSHNPAPGELPQTQLYATIKVGSKVVASVDNQGVITTASGLSKELLDMLVNDLNGASGPNLAQERAEILAGYFGAKVEKADTAINQLEFDLLPDITDMPVHIDYTAMQNDPMFEQLQNLMTSLKNYESQRQAFLAGIAPDAQAEV